MKYKFIPVENNIDKAFAFANTLDVNNIINTNPELDENGWGMYGLHDIRKTLGKESIPLKHYLN
jgi:hypothetical protein